VDRLREAQDGRLGRAVGGLEGDRLERDQRREVQDRAAAALDHAGKEDARERDHRLDVGADHLGLGVRVEADELAAAAVARVVHEDLDGQAASLELGLQLLARVDVGDVHGDRLGAHVVLPAELVGELAQLLLAPRRECHAEAAAGELARDLRADSRRRAGDEAGGVG
jgi:hypothetical protein